MSAAEWTRSRVLYLEGSTIELCPQYGSDLYYVMDSRNHGRALVGALPLKAAKQAGEREARKLAATAPAANSAEPQARPASAEDDAQLARGGQLFRVEGDIPAERVLQNSVLGSRLLVLVPVEPEQTGGGAT